jgi:protein involved in polysaccharide export with SLBB domain
MTNIIKNITICLLVTIGVGCKEPGTIGRFKSIPVTNIILDNLGVVDEDPEPYVGARDAVAQDLVPSLTEYVIGPGDILRVSINELYQVDQQWTDNIPVSDTGYITLPVIGQVPAANLTELEVIAKIEEELVPDIIKSPNIGVVVLSSNTKTFLISGAVRAPGPYELRRPDLRISEAFALAGGIPSIGSDFAYVIRTIKDGELANLEDDFGGYDDWSQTTGDLLGSQDVNQNTEEVPMRGEVEDEVQDVEQETEVATEQEMEEDIKEVIDTIDAPGDLPEVEVEAPEDEETSSEELIDSISPLSVIVILSDNPDNLNSERNELIEAVFEEKAVDETGVTDWDVDAKVLKDGDQWKIVSNGGVAQEVEAPMPQGKQSADEAVWGFEKGNALGISQEVIRIDLRKLNNGDLSQNIVIQPGDDIHTPVNSQGVFYVMGQMGRTGTYNISQGQKMTLKQVIAAAGPFTPTAWPSRCELTRRVGRNKEVSFRVNLQKLMEGKAPNMFIKEGDVINIGSHPVARWLAVVRQSFRATYGFGFVYDRNFADKDFGH